MRDESSNTVRDGRPSVREPPAAEGDRRSPGPDAGRAPRAAGPGSDAPATTRPPPPVARYRPRPFRPAWWLPGAHAQTLGARILRPRQGPRRLRERWETPDGDFVDLDFFEATAATAVGDSPDSPPTGRSGPDAAPGRGGARGDETPAVLVLHGLEGCADSGYVRQLARELNGRGLSAVALNFRSRSGEPNRTRRFYHSGETGDVTFVLDRLRERRDGPLGAVGFSLGGNVLLKHLGERGRGASRTLAAAVAVSVPYRLAAGAEALERGFCRVYAGYFLRSLRASVRRKHERHGHDYDLEALDDARTMRDFDDAFTAPIHGFEGADDYYRRSSSARFLANVRVPTLLLQARDDPFLPEAALPLEEMRQNPWLRAVVTDRGGHVGFVEGRLPGRARFWAETEAARFLAGALLDDG